MTPPLDVFGLSEIIEGFVFREKGGVKILKKWREEAVIMQVDVEIVSTSRPQYLSFASLPPTGFYGYANLIMRDFSLPSIAIVQPRQTLYYAVNEFAQTAWMQFHNMVRHQENAKGIEELVCFNTGLLNGACIAKECKPIPTPSFIEFPLREVLINTHFGTQFNVELSYWKINNVLDNCGNIVSPKSNQTDGDKDNGLPPFGVMPQTASPDNPYTGLPPVSPWDREGVIALSRLDDLGKPNPDNAVEPAVQGGEEDGANYTIEVFFGVDYLNSSNTVVGSSTGSVIFSNSIGAIKKIFASPEPSIRTGDFVGTVSNDIFVEDKFSLKAGSLGSTNINPPFPASFGATKWRLIGINSFTITKVS
jgi:hypothetical protein